MAIIIKLNSIANTDRETAAPSVDELERRVQEEFEALLQYVKQRATEPGLTSFMLIEKQLWEKVMALGRAVTVLFLGIRERQVAAKGPIKVWERHFRPAPKQARNLTTLFGTVRYWRQYMQEVSAEVDRRGFYPLERALGLMADRVSFNVLSAAVRLATKLVYAQVHTTLEMFMPNAPSTEVIEQAVLGFGSHSERWFEQAPPPSQDGADGEVLVIGIDSKGAPTATESELKRRRGKRRKSLCTGSKRHRGRERRGRWPKRPRRRKGDKSKNARMATLVLMYTLKREGDLLLGPRNSWVYASFGPKRHAFAIARREAAKRGFGPDSGKLVQFVSDGDNDLERYRAEYLPHAQQTLDVIHVVEKLWTAGECFYAEGSVELTAWVHGHKKRLYAGKVRSVVQELNDRLKSIPKTGPGNKGKRDRLEEIIEYLDKRIEQMNYHELLAQDLEICSGPTEGAVKNVIGKRCDHGGMRWIRERAEALLKLRCIEINGDWERFAEFAHKQLWAQSLVEYQRFRLQTSTASDLPNLAEAA
jgi:hypothetical protein